MSWLRELGKIVLRILRELSDETAYSRHLAREGVEHSAEEWRRFSDARLRRKYLRAKCC